MGKGQRSKKNNAATYSAANEAKKGSAKKILSIVGAILAVAIVVGLVVYGKLANNGHFLRKQAALKSENFTVSSTEMSYFFRTTLTNALSDQSSAYLYYYMGLDTSKSLKSQLYYGSTTQTWFDYFMSNTVSSVKQLLVLAEAGKAAGVELDDDDKAVIDANISALKAAAKESGYGEDYYIRNLYGTGVSVEDIKNALTLQSLASKYYDQVHDELKEKFTKDDFDKYFEENPDKLLHADILTYTFTYTPETEDTTATKEDYTEDEANYESIMKFADELAATKNADEYKAYVRNYIEKELYKDYTVVESKPDTTSTSTTEGGKKIITVAELDAAAEKIVSSRKTHTEGDELSDWIFADDTAKFATKTDKSFAASTNKYSVTVTMLAEPKYRDEYATRDFAHILFGVGDGASYKTDAEAKAKAEEILAQFNAGTKDQTAFEALALLNTDDSGTTYVNVEKNQMVESVNDWLFDDARKAGDTEIVKSDYGYHIMFYIGEGKTAWENQANANLISDTYSDMYKGFAEKYKITVDDAALSAIDG